MRVVRYVSPKTGRLVRKGTKGAKRRISLVSYPPRAGAILIQVGEKKFLSTGKKGRAIRPLVDKINRTLKKLGLEGSTLTPAEIRKLAGYESEKGRRRAA